MAKAEHLIRRARLTIGLCGTLRLMILAAFPGCLLAAVWRIAWMLGGHPALAAVWPVLPVAFFGAAMIVSLADPISPRLAAAVADRSLILKDRLVTWEELSRLSGGKPAMFPLLEKDLVSRLAGVPGSGQALKLFRWPVELRYLPLPVAVLALAALWPLPQPHSDIESIGRRTMIFSDADAVKRNPGEKNTRVTGDTAVVYMRPVRSAPPVSLDRPETRWPIGSRNVIAVVTPARRAGKDAGSKLSGESVRSVKRHHPDKAPAGAGTGDKNDRLDSHVAPVPRAGSATAGLPRQAVLDRTLRSQVERFPEVGLSLARFYKAQMKAFGNQRGDQH